MIESKLKQIKLIITDVDGVLTDGSLIYDAHGEAIKIFNARDGLGTRLLIENGIQIAALSGRDSAVLRCRLKDIGIHQFQLGKLDKQTAFFELIKATNVTPEQTAFIGDDSIDLPAFALCGLSVAVGDAMPYVKSQADLVLTAHGGRGAFREFADMLLKAQGKADSYQTATGFLKKVKGMGQ